MAHTRPTAWLKRPGNWDTLRTQQRFISSNRWGFPDLRPCTWTPPPDAPLIAYPTRDDSGHHLARGIAHFFLDDYRFESVWSRPQTALARVKRFRATLGPDFSLYRDWPLAAQIWNTHRARVVTRTWQDQGVLVVPVVNWGLPDTWEWCFAGIHPGGTLALSVPDWRDRVTRTLFIGGWNAMVERLTPKLVLVYGHLPFLSPTVEVAEYQPDWHRLRSHGNPATPRTTAAYLTHRSCWC